MLRRTHIARLIPQCGFELQGARRKHPRVINCLVEKSPKRSRNSHDRDIQPRIRLRQGYGGQVDTNIFR